MIGILLIATLALILWLNKKLAEANRIEQIDDIMRANDKNRYVRRWIGYLLIRQGSLWIGAHWSRQNRRLCINVLPCITIAIVRPDGVRPLKPRRRLF